MARAAAKRPRTERPEPPRRRKETRPKSVEDTLFFNRLRRQAKWVFVLLALVFGLGFVIFGVGSDIGGGLSDLFRDGTSGNGSPSVNKALRQTQDEPKNPAAWRALGEAYEFDGQEDRAIEAWTKFTELAGRDGKITGYGRLAQLYDAKAQRQTTEAQRAGFEAQALAATDFAPPTTTPLGRALAEEPNQVAQTLALAANQRYNAALQARSETLTKLVDTYSRLTTLEPNDPDRQLQLAFAAEQAGDAQRALTAYRQFLELADSDNPQVPGVREAINRLQTQLG